MASTDQDVPTDATPASGGEPQVGSTNSFGSRTPYYASAYFTPFYFYGGAATETPTVPGRTSGRDAGCYAALVDRLEAIDSFDAVIFGEPTRRTGTGAETHPLAILIPRGWTETDETDPVLWDRRVLFTIRIVVRVEDDPMPFDQLDQLAASVQAQVDLADLGGDCLPSLTKIRAGRYGTSCQYPEWSIDLDGEFAVLIDPSAPPLVF